MFSENVCCSVLLLLLPISTISLGAFLMGLLYFAKYFAKCSLPFLVKFIGSILLTFTFNKSHLHIEIAEKNMPKNVLIISTFVTICFTNSYFSRQNLNYEINFIHLDDYEISLLLSSRMGDVFC